MPSNKPYIYVAGPLFTIQDREFLIKIRNMIRNLGCDTFLPQEDNNDNANGRKTETTQAKLKNIFRNDYKAIDRADAVIALLDGVPIDCGTAWEIGYAFAKGKPILGYRTDFRVLGNFDNQRIDLMSEAACTELLFVPEADINKIEAGISAFLTQKVIAK